LGLKGDVSGNVSGQEFGLGQFPLVAGGIGIKEQNAMVGVACVLHGMIWHEWKSYETLNFFGKRFATCFGAQQNPRSV
jgi:hypothetical protein